VGFAMGIERLVLLLETLNLVPEQAADKVDIFVVSLGEQAELASSVLAEGLRNEYVSLTVLRHCGGGNFKNQMKKADRSGARFTLILGENEVADGVCQVKNMATGEQETIATEQVAQYLASHF
jgi:histidyl-tRNA synthetase